MDETTDIALLPRPFQNFQKNYPYSIVYHKLLPYCQRIIQILRKMRFPEDAETAGIALLPQP